MSWQKIDLEGDGPRGFDSRYESTQNSATIFFLGSNHWWDWGHHVWFGAAKREIAAARKTISKLTEDFGGELPPSIHVGGHSLGGSVAESMASILVEEMGYSEDQVSCYTFGSKRPPRGYQYNRTQRIFHVDDLVPYLPPWRPAIAPDLYIGSGTYRFWNAHKPSEYKEVMKRTGF